MEPDSENFEKIFNEMIQSEDLKEISESITKKDVKATDLLDLQMELLDAASHISSLLHKNVSNDDNFSAINENGGYVSIYNLHKTCEEFNDFLVEYIIENDILGEEFFEDEDEENDDES